MNRADEIIRTISSLQYELENIQRRCPHTKVKATPGGDTGNWDPSEDSYWVEVFCPKCKMRKRIFSDHVDYKKYTRQV